MTYFTKDFIQFFKDLAVNNHKDWFHANKKRYDTSVKQPFYTFVEDLTAALNQRGESIKLLPKDAILRINRDIRFSKDKTPYNISYTALISSAGKKDKSMPGLYLRMTPEGVDIMGGVYAPSTPQLNAIRQYISENLTTFQALLKQPQFIAKFNGIQGEAHRRIPKPYQATFEKEPLIANKQFYFHSNLPAKAIYSNNLLEQVLELWDIASPMHHFFKAIIEAEKASQNT